MHTRHFTLKITGELVAGSNREQVVAHFAQLLGLPLASAGDLLEQGPRTIRESLDRVLAERYQAALGHIGIRSVIEHEADPPTVIMADHGFFDADASNASDHTLR